MNATNHSPLPWRYSDVHETVVDAHGNDVWTEGDYDYSPSPPNDEDRRFIVHAVNNHEPMLAFLKEIVVAAESANGWLGISNRALIEGAKIVANAEKP